MTSGPVVALELEGEDAVPAWRQLLGPTNSIVAKAEAPTSLRSRFGTGQALHVDASSTLDRLSIVLAGRTPT